MLLIGGLDYLFALALERAERPAVRKVVLGLSVLVNMGFLFYFKYAGFAAGIIDGISDKLGLAHQVHATFANVILPVGISFYTFESMSYIIDVYRRETSATRRLVDYWTFITFFPHLIAGPIIRYADLRSQLTNRSHSWEGLLSGFRRFTIGLSKKVILANPMGFYADRFFMLDSARIDSLGAWLAAATYTLQIYFDFSGYSDMAIGLARMFGIRLPENFNYPYIARSVREFWRRWHITLSQWFRDYVYIPLGGNRHGTVVEYRNLLLVFILCGLWHGASWNFLAWGVYHGAFLVVERVIVGRMHIRIPTAAQHIYAMAAIAFGWIIFRAETMEQCLNLWKAMAGFGAGFVSVETLEQIFLPHFLFYFILAVIFAIPVHRRFRPDFAIPSEAQVCLRFDLVMASLFLVSCVFLCGQEYNPFIYFRF